MTGQKQDGLRDDIEAAIELLRGAAVGTASDAGLAAMVGACGRVRSWIAAVESSCVSEVRRRKGDAQAVLSAEQRGSRRQASASVRRSKLIDRLPGVGDALASGAITADHVDAFASVRSAYADALAAGVGRLLDHAAKVGADQLRDRLRRWQLEQDRQSGANELERQRRARRGSVSTRADDGMGVFHFELDSVASARVKAVLAKKSEALWRVDNAGSVGERRTSAQRMADAFEELVCGEGGVGATVMVVADYDTLVGQVGQVGQVAGGRCGLVDGTPLPVDEVRRLAVDAKVIPAIFDRDGQPLWLGRSARLPNAAQRAAIAVRDRGCTVPGCDVPVDWCQIHHILWWSHGGATDLDNLTTVCSAHHHMIHEQGWSIGRGADGTISWRGPPKAPA